LAYASGLETDGAERVYAMAPVLTSDERRDIIFMIELPDPRAGTGIVSAVWLECSAIDATLAERSRPANDGIDDELLELRNSLSVVVARVAGALLPASASAEGGAAAAAIECGGGRQASAPESGPDTVLLRLRGAWARGTTGDVDAGRRSA